MENTGKNVFFVKCFNTSTFAKHLLNIERSEDSCFSSLSSKGI